MIYHLKTNFAYLNHFVFEKSVTAKSHACLNKDIFFEFFNNFTFNNSALKIETSNELSFIIGSVSKPILNGNSYAINVEEKGICLLAKSEKDLIYAFMTLLDKIKISDDNIVYIPCFNICETPLIENRMVHFCVSPQIKLKDFERFVRFCGALKYSHIIVEFWGMLKFDALKELSWNFAYSKEEIKPIIKLANDLGIEIVPMFNHWGHASGARVIHGKHVVLDQNLSLQPYFSEDGWSWNIKSEKVKKLLKEVRSELISLCGKGEFFHIGCDEAYNFNLTEKENMDAICDYINEINLELNSLGRKTIIWGDMFISRRQDFNPKNRYCCYSPNIDSEKYMLAKINKNIIIADWQYTCEYAPVETSLIFKEAGFNTILCPWDRSAEELYSCTSTIKENNLFGLIHTTWNTLDMGMPFVAMASVASFEDSKPSVMAMRPKTAALFRKIYKTNGDFNSAGWFSFGWEE